MTVRVIDARGLSCPEPVVRARKAMQETPDQAIRILVSEDVSVENITRMAQTQGWRVQVERQNADYAITLSPGDGPALSPSAQPSGTAEPPHAKIVVLLASNVIGTGDDQLGRVLMRAFVKTLREVKPLPKKAIFMNAGVMLTTEGSELIDDLRALEQAGVELLSCGTCLDFFHRLDKLQVGRKSNMLEIVTALADADRVIRP